MCDFVMKLPTLCLCVLSFPVLCDRLQLMSKLLTTILRKTLVQVPHHIALPFCCCLKLFLLAILLLFTIVVSVLCVQIKEAD